MTSQLLCGEEACGFPPPSPPSAGRAPAACALSFVPLQLSKRTAVSHGRPVSSGGPLPGAQDGHALMLCPSPVTPVAGRPLPSEPTPRTVSRELVREHVPAVPPRHCPCVFTQQTLNPHNGKRGDCLPPARCSAHTTLMILVGAECPHVQPLPRRPADGGHRAPRQLGHLGAVTASRSAWRLTQGHSELFAQTEGHLLLIICSLGFENENSPSKFFDRKRTKKKHKSMGKTPDH